VSVVRSTLAALIQPKRLVPILIVCLPLLWAQASWSRDPLALPQGILMCVLFAVGAPVGWRLLVPSDLALTTTAVRVALYAIFGTLVVYLVGLLVPSLLGMNSTFLTTPVNLMVCLALFLVGGWGLGRDVELEGRLAQAQARALALGREAERAQLMALRSHLDPHFLFNTLNAIAEWCREDGAVAERAVLQLSAMLRTVLSGVKDSTWPIQRELELVDTLLSLHLLRDDKLFTLEKHVPADLPAIRIPPMILLPLVENAVKHGPAAGHRGTLVLQVMTHAEMLRVTISNPGSYKGPREGSDGLPTVRKRLALAYGPAATLDIHGEGDRTVVDVALPLSGPLLEDAA